MGPHVSIVADGVIRGEASGEGTVPRRALLAELVERLLTVDPEEHALRRLVGALAEGIPSVDSAALLVRDVDGRLEVVAQVGLDEDATGAVDGGLAGAVLDAGAVRVAVVPGPPLPRGTRVAAAAPVRAGDTVGALLVGSRGTDRLDDDALLLLRVAADRAALVLDRARMRRSRDDALETLRRAEADIESRRKAVDFILGVVGHDLRNPLGAVHMSASLLHTKGGLSGWQARAVERARSSAGRMGRIIADLLSYTRTRLGNGIPIACRASSLDPIVRKVVDELSAVNPDRTITVEVKGDPAGEWDPDRLEQVASNLVSNAIDHGELAGPVSVEVDGTAPDAVVLRVRNDGPGMPQEVIDHLFEPFSRAPDSKSRKASGLGLGLFIAREIVRGHGGQIGAASGAETVVTVTLPRRSAV
jgi:signal transduction histidine kinase